MTSLREAAQQALKAMEKATRFMSDKDYRKLNESIDVLKVALAGHECHNCASLEAQNTELDRKLADLEQTSLELCKACGWRTVIPGEGCLNCARSKLAELERKPLTEEEIKRIDDSTHFHESPDWSLRFARAIERAHGIGDSDE